MTNIVEMNKIKEEMDLERYNFISEEICRFMLNLYEKFKRADDYEKEICKTMYSKMMEATTDAMQMHLNYEQRSNRLD